MRSSLILLGIVSVLCGCAAKVQLTSYPGDQVKAVPKEECKLDTAYTQVKVLGSLPEEGTYIELGYMNVKQESGSEFVYTSEEKQIEAARIQACQWGADAIVVMRGQSDKGSDFWTGYKDRRETKIIAIRFKTQDSQ